MKTLFLIRHAKSSRALPVADIRRPLSERGLADAPRMGARLKEKGAKLDAFYSSPAKRAFDTAKIIAENCGFPVRKIITDDRFYTFDSGKLLRAVESMDERFSAAAVFCHNFAITDLANFLTGEKIENVPTCGIVRIRTDAELWADISVKKGILIDFDFPKKGGR